MKRGGGDIKRGSLGEGKIFLKRGGEKIYWTSDLINFQTG